MRGFTDPTKFSQDLSFMENEDWKRLRKHDREMQKEREREKRELREKKGNWK